MTTEAAFHDHWISSKGPALRDIAEHLHHRLEVIKPSQRRDAGQRKRHLVNNLVANIAYLILSPEHARRHREGPDDTKRLAVSTAKKARTRYDRVDHPQGLCAGMLNALEEQGVIIKHPSVFKRQHTTIEPTASFIDTLSANGASMADIGRYQGAEAIWLTARTGEAGFGGEPAPKTLVHYKDNAESNRYREEVLQFNTFLNQQHLAFDGIQQAPSALRRMFLLRRPDDPVTFNLNGRLNGGFWMNLPARYRHLITLNGEPLVDLDFVSMFAHLAYRKAGTEAPPGDLYAIPGLEDHRSGAKAGLLSLLSRTGPMERLSVELKAKLPEDWTAKRLVEAMQSFHPAIAHLFGSDVGIALMFAESQILMAALLEMKALGIPALGMHDGAMAPVSVQACAIAAMQRATIRIVGVPLPIVEKPMFKPLS